ncbi:MAG: hypothetical protein DHS20C15_12610 [Planctomycetota bacterium]|nr:MAG: hypothetical protein DHS20C15_12610 [Planctomycetota bacterium]
MTDTPTKFSPAARALLIALAVAGGRAVVFVALGNEVDDAVGGSLTIGYGLVTSLITMVLLFFFAWLALRGKESRAVRGVLWTFAALISLWTARTVVLMELDRRAYAAARDPDATPERLHELDLNDSIVRWRVASNPASPPDLLRELSELRFVSRSVRAKLERHPNTPADLRAELRAELAAREAR